MIPGVLAQDIAQSLREFIVTGFETDTWPFNGKFEQLVNTSNNGEAFIKGPYVSISLPFAKNQIVCNCLVVDELHTFDSAQGSDLAMLEVERIS